MEKKKLSLREKLTSAVFIVVTGVFFLLNIVLPAPQILEGERRAPAKFPELSLDSILSGSFMSKFEDYAADNFVLRDTFRGIHAFTVLDLLMQSDKSGLYRDQYVGAGEFNAVNEVSFTQTAEKIKKAAQSLEEHDLCIYYSIVPDKSIYAKQYMPGFSLDEAEGILLDVLADYSYIPLDQSLSADSFYKTDLHWDQSKIGEAVSSLLSAMGDGPAAGEYPAVTAGEFRGVYAGQLALPMPADNMTYADIPGLTVSYLNENTLEFEPGPLYDMEGFESIDPYDIFLRGPQPLITIKNPAAPRRELYLFRDSFGSSLSPLLAASYSKVTVIDLRYIHFSLLSEFVEFAPGSDVLFLYSSQIFNNPSILQI